MIKKGTTGSGPGIDAPGTLMDNPPTCPSVPVEAKS